MNAEPATEFSRLRLPWRPVAAWLVLGLSLGASAEIVAPYQPDRQTLHLWHLNEPAAPIADAVSSGVELLALGNGATLGNESFVDGKKFGTALGTYVGNPATAPGCAGQDAYLAAQPLENGRGDNVPFGYAGEGGAFTFEAIVRVDFDPTANFGSEGWGQGRSLFMQIISGDADENDDRIFQFRLAPIGTLNGNPQPLLEFINLNQGRNAQSLTAAIPTNGPDAIRAGNWYHLAVAYDGRPDQPDNLRFYWTLIQSKRTATSLIGAGQMNHSLPTGCNPDFAIGQTGRQSPATPKPNNNFVGLIDEVRISSVARSPREMLFGESSVAGDPVRAAASPNSNLAATAGTDRSATEGVASPGGPFRTIASAISPASLTSEAAVDTIRRMAESATVVSGTIIRGPRSRPRVALLFSCRESDVNATALLQTLKMLQTRASFFVSSSFLNQAGNVPLVQSMLADGHYVGPQADTWVQVGKGSQSQNTATIVSSEVEEHLSRLAALGINRNDVRYFLPTSDQLTPAVVEQARSVGLTMVAGTSGTLSFASATAEGTKEFVSSEAIVASILQIENRSKGLNGFLLLFPFESGARRADLFYPHFTGLIRKLRQDGYEFVRVDELLDNSPPGKASSLAAIKHP